jgi:predicted glycosyltransferase involved in capsule biosynthesis
MELQVGYCSVVKYNSIQDLNNFFHIFRPTSANHFGGVTALSTNDFQSVNGFSNSFWGWGGEDDQLYQRVKRRQVTKPERDESF